MTTSTQDSGQSPRIGQRLPAEGGSKIELVEDVLSLPEAPWPGRMVYNTDLSAFQIYSGNVGGWITANDAGGNITFVQDTEPTATSVGDWWVKTNGPGIEDNQLYVWDGTDWILYLDPTASAAQIAADLAQAAADAAQAAAEAAQDAADNALADAADAQATADGKVRSFFQTTAPTGMTAGDVGDLWFDTDDGNKLYMWDGDSWELADDQRIAEAVTAADNAQATADGKITTFYTTSAPTAEGVGDLWVDTDDKNKLYRWSGSTWQTVRDVTISEAQTAADAAQAAADDAATDAATAIADAATAQATADGKVETYFQSTQPTTPPASVGDVWFNTETGQASNLFSIGATDDDDVWAPIQDNRLVEALQAAQDAQSTADGKITTFYGTADEIASEFPALGDLWYNTDEDNARYRWGYDTEGTLNWLILPTPTLPEKIQSGTVGAALDFSATNTLKNAISDPGTAVPSIVQGHATGQAWPATPGGYANRGFCWDSENGRWIQLLERTETGSPNTGSPFIRTVSTGGSAGTPQLCDTNGIDAKGVRWGISYWDNGLSGSPRFIYCVVDTGPQTQSIFRIRVDGTAGSNFGNYSADRALAVGDAVVLLGDTSGNQYVIAEAAFTSTGSKKIVKYTNTLGTATSAFLSISSSTYYANAIRGGGVGDYGYGSSKITLLGSSSSDYHMVFDLPAFTSDTKSINTTYSYAHNSSCSGWAAFKTTTGEIHSWSGGANTSKWSTFWPGSNTYWSATYANGVSGSLTTQHTAASNYGSVAVTPRNYFSISLPAAPTGITAARVWVKYGSSKLSGAPSGSHYNAGDITVRTLSLGSAEGSPVDKTPGTGSTNVWNASLGLPSQLGVLQSQAGGLLLKGDGTLQATDALLTTPDLVSWPASDSDRVSSNITVNSTSYATLMTAAVNVLGTSSKILVFTSGNASFTADGDQLTIGLYANGSLYGDEQVIRGLAQSGTSTRIAFTALWLVTGLPAGSRTFLIRGKIGGAGQVSTVATGSNFTVMAF